MARRHRTEREVYWQHLIDRQGTSEQSIADFCKGEGVSTASFYAWRHRLQSPRRVIDPRDSRPALVPVRIVSEAPTAREAVTIEWPGGIVLRVATGCDAATLRTVVATLNA
jgi:hypothetical protein